MSVVRKAANRHTVVATGWSTPEGAYDLTPEETGTDRASLSTAKNTTYSGDFGFPDFTTSDIPDGATINSVRVNVSWGLSGDVTGGELGCQPRLNNANSGSEVTQTFISGIYTEYATFGTVTLSDLRSAETSDLIEARVRATRGSTNTGMVGYLYAIDLEVDFTATPTSTSVARVSLASASTPSTRTKHYLHIRARVTSAYGVMPTMRVALYEGSTNRSGDLETSALTTTLAEYVLPISDANAANITSYSDLEVRFWGYSAGGFPATFEVDSIYLELPAGSGGGSGTLAADAIVRASSGAKTLAADAVIKSSSGTKALAADAWFASTVTDTFTADAVLKKTILPSLAADAVIRSPSGTKTFTADAVLRRAATGSFTADAVIKRTVTTASLHSVSDQGFHNSNFSWTHSVGPNTKSIVVVYGRRQQWEDYAFSYGNKPLTRVQSTAGGGGDGSAIGIHLLADISGRDDDVIRVTNGTLGNTNIGSIAFDGTDGLIDSDLVAYTYGSGEMKVSLTGPGIAVAVGLDLDSNYGAPVAESLAGQQRVWSGAHTYIWYSYYYNADIKPIGASGDIGYTYPVSRTRGLVAVSLGGLSPLTADAVLKAEGTGSFTADAVIQGAVESQFAADSLFLKSSGELTFTADAWVAGVGTGAFTADAVIKSSVSGAFLADAIRLKTVIAEGEVDFPQRTAVGANEVDGLSGTVDIPSSPSGSGAGDIVLIHYYMYNNSGGIPVLSGWSSLGRLSYVNRDLETFWKRDDGTLGGTQAVVGHNGSSTGACWIVERWAGCHPSSNPVNGGDVSGGPSINIGSLTTGWGAENTTWIVVGANSATYVLSSSPAGYTLNQTSSATRLYVRSRELAAASEDPGSFVWPTGTYCSAYVVALRPAPAAPPLTADAVISKAQSGSFSADAVIKTAASGSLTADALLSSVQSGQLTADAVIFGTQTSSFTAGAVIYVEGSAVCVWTTPADTIQMDASPTLEFLTPTSVVGDMHFEIQVDTVDTYPSPTIWKSHWDQTGWEYWDGDSWESVPQSGVPAAFAGNEARYTLQSPLANGTYYRRVRAGVI